MVVHGELVDEVHCRCTAWKTKSNASPLSFNEDGQVYFVRFLEHGLKGKTAPLEVVRYQIVELVLQSRRQKLREALRDTLYQQAWANGSLRREKL